MRTIFRKSSLKRLSSPEQLDIMVKITSPLGWLSMLSIGFLIIIAILWGVYGSIPTKVKGMGILMRSSIFSINAENSGKIEDIYVAPGSIVQEGEIIGRISQPDIINQIKIKKNNLAQLKQKYYIFKQTTQNDIKLKEKLYNKQKQNLLTLINQCKIKIKWLKNRLSDQNFLYKKGLITINKVLETKAKIFELKNSIKKYKNQIRELDIKMQDIINKFKNNCLVYEDKIDNLEKNIAILEENFNNNTRIITPYKGRVVEILVEKDQTISRGEKILTMQLLNDTRNLKGIIYVSSINAQKIKTGMKVEVSPTIVKQEEYGFMLGIVSNVSSFPSSPQGMMKILQNQNLVKTFARNGAPTEVQVIMIPSEKTYSGYKWSSKKGPPIKIYSGTFCFATIITKEQAPITLVIPFLKKFFLGTDVN